MPEKPTRILHLTLHRKWFDEIASGKKRTEYRENKAYWAKRLNRNYDEIHFRNGYSKDAPFMRVEWCGCTEHLAYYAIFLGNILEIKNWSA